jgi:hypothetical protein
MARTTLKKLMGEAGAGLDQSHSPPAPGRLYDVLLALINQSRAPLLNVHFAGTVVTGVLARVPITAPDVLRELSARLDVCGTAGNTVVQVRLNGVSVGSLTIDNAAADPTQAKVQLGTVPGAGIDVKDGDIVDINVSAAPTAGSGLTVAVRSCPIDVEP